MSIRLQNDWNYKGDDRWDWEIYLTSDMKNELKEINKVKYILHPTFKKPIRIIEDETNGFKLKMNGWGVFLVKAFAYFKNGNTMKLEHQLELKYNPQSGTSKFSDYGRYI